MVCSKQCYESRRENAIYSSTKHKCSKPKGVASALSPRCNFSLGPLLKLETINCLPYHTLLNVSNGLSMWALATSYLKKKRTNNGLDYLVSSFPLCCLYWAWKNGPVICDPVLFLFVYIDQMTNNTIENCV